ncbi:hypothetical protein ACJRO7_010045 [Eucalyptus globulus]|uniref:BPL/LPL catalytic domain-containing protein n=1 Tax=Eucalyptus globulus TaxID=34317 RepID=A0ABD3LAQ4_EUCGL
MKFVRLRGWPILQQLHIEEQLLQTLSKNWCIINDGIREPTIVMDISGKPAELLEIKPVLHDQVPVIKRFTEGGTVIVDGGTIFVTFICNKDAVPELQPYPRPIMSWSSLIYNEVFHGTGDFHLRENEVSSLTSADKAQSNSMLQSTRRRRWRELSRRGEPPSTRLPLCLLQTSDIIVCTSISTNMDTTTPENSSR